MDSVSFWLLLSVQVVFLATMSAKCALLERRSRPSAAEQVALRRLNLFLRLLVICWTLLLVASLLRLNAMT